MRASIGWRETWPMEGGRVQVGEWHCLPASLAASFTFAISIHGCWWLSLH